MGGAEEEGDGIGRSRRDPGNAVLSRLEYRSFTEKRGDFVEDGHRAGSSAIADCGLRIVDWTLPLRFRNPKSAVRNRLHSRHACTGTTLPGFTRSFGSNTRRTACIAPNDSGSKMSGM